MDLLTQGLLGSCTAASSARSGEVRSAALIGLIAGLAIDLDVLIASDQDPLLNIEYHRHFSHSIFFVPIAALIVSLLVWPFLRRGLPWRRLYWYALAGCLFSGLLDACTSYGTRLLWPLFNERFSFNIISIVDPVFTLALIVGLVLGVTRHARRWSALALGFALAYLGFGFSQNRAIEAQALELARQAQHQPEDLLVKPTLGNLFLWRTVYLHGDRYYVNAIRYNPFSGSRKVYGGGSVLRFDALNHGLSIPSDSRLQQDLQRFNAFSNGYLAYHPAQKNIVIDVRYANLPDQVNPLWGIEFDPRQPALHARYETYRDSSRATRERFLAMLLD
jgi:inner membrane protein